MNPEDQNTQSHEVARLTRDLRHMRTVYGVSLIVVILVITACVPLLAPQFVSTWGSQQSADATMSQSYRPKPHAAPAVMTTTHATSTATSTGMMMTASTTKPSH